jgi:ribosomal protein S19
LAAFDVFDGWTVSQIHCRIKAVGHWIYSFEPTRKIVGETRKALGDHRVLL